MMGLTEIIASIRKKELTEQQRLKILQSRKINEKVDDYLNGRLYNLCIQIEDQDEHDIFSLMSRNKLEGWCWQTTETAIVFFNDDDYIARGYLYFDENRPKYYHSWICFNYYDTNYVFDPCLNIICKKEKYDRIFNPDVKAEIKASIVKEKLIKYSLEETRKFEEKDSRFDQLMKEILGRNYDTYLERYQDEFSIEEIDDDVNKPFYRNSCGYKVRVENNKVKKLKAHYYMPECI